ncbi:MAG: DJ-1/PfpI family protein [Clostridia bacterium]|nr:DJ-1/PfpI family protein [Clostridia bacterium]
MVYVFLADGFEEAEALFPVDILRRGGIAIQTVGVTGKTVTGSHGIPVIADLTADETSTDGLQGVILPGGMPGTINLANSTAVKRLLEFAVQNKLLIGAICAAPSVLGQNGMLNGRRAVCYPGFEEKLLGATVCNDAVVQDGNIITAKGAGCAADFGFALLTYLSGNNQQTEDLQKGMCFA